MFLISVEKVEPGMMLAKTLYSADGTVLLYEGVKMTAGNVAKLQSLGIASVYIHTECLHDVIVEDLIVEETRVKVLCLTREVMEAAKVQDLFTIEEIEEQIEIIMHRLMENPEVLIQMTDIRAQRDYTFGHCVSVCVISLIIGIALGYDEDKLRILGMGALLHDIGKGKIPASILEKPGKLSEEEFTVIQSHSAYGFEILQTNEAIDMAIALVSLQHHEKFNGKGYPWNLKGDEISEFARVVAVADVYDALTTDRVYRRRFLPHEALEMIESDAGEHFDPDIVKAFRRFVAIYPVGCLVQLNTGKLAVVIKVSPQAPRRPVVRIMENSPVGRQYDELDLQQASDFFVKKIIRQ